MAISNRKIIVSVYILIPFVFLWCIKMCHKDLCKGFIDEKSFVLGESTIKDMQKRFNIYKDLEIPPITTAFISLRLKKKKVL